MQWVIVGVQPPYISVIREGLRRPQKMKRIILMLLKNRRKNLSKNGLFYGALYFTTRTRHFSKFNQRRTDFFLSLYSFSTPRIDFQNFA